MKNIFQPPVTPVIPDHQLIRRIGEGSYGEIWLAKNILGTYRAVKIVYRASFDTERPYEREFQGIQKFEPISRSHPGLVDILQIGRNDEKGYFYYVMELADDERGGSTFHPDDYSAKTLSKEVAARGRLPAAESLLLGQHLTAALAHMHKHELVHRDIKPSNIIFVNGEPKLADIGLVTLVTAARTYVGTEGYIPPEGPGSIRADIYSLGMVLYEISTGLDRQLHPTLPADLWQFTDSQLVVELNEVVVKACAELPAARYASAEDFRSDLQMLAGGRSVKRLRFVERQLRRVKRFAIVTTALAIVAIIFGSIVTASRARERVLLTHNYLTSGTRLMEEGNLHGALPLLAEALRLQKGDSPMLDTHRTRLGSVLQQSPKLLQFWQTDSGLTDAHFSPDSKHVLLAGTNGAWLMNIQTGSNGMRFPADRPVQSAAFSPDGQRVVLAYEHFISVREVSTGSNSFKVRIHDLVNTVDFSPDGKMILVACGRNCVHLFDAADGRANGEALRGHTKPVTFAAFSPDGSLIITAAQDGTARIWDLQSRETKQILRHSEANRLQRPPWVLAAAFSPDGRHVVTSSADRTLRVWNVADGSVSLARMEHRGGVRRARFSPDGRFIISAGFDQTARIWDALTGRAVGAMNLRSAAMQAEFDADACRIVVAGAAGEVKVWHVTPTAPVSAGPGIISGNGERYVTFSSNTFQLRNARDDSPIGPGRTAPDMIARLLCDSSGDRVVVQTPDSDNDSKLAHIFIGGVNSTNSFSAPGTGGRWWLNDSGTKLITATHREIFLWDIESGTLKWGPVNSSAKVNQAAFSPDGRMIALAAETGVFLIDARTGKPLGTALQLEQNVQTVMFSPDSARLLTATRNSGFAPGAAHLWNVRTSQRVGSAMPHADGVADARFSHDGQLIATIGEDNRARVWNAANGTPIAEPIGLLLPALSVEFSADDRWLITATWFGVQVWNARTGHAVTPPFTDGAIFERAGFCATGQRIWAQSRRGLLFWNLPREMKGADELIALADHFGVTVPADLQWNHDAFTLAKLRDRCADERAHLQTNLQSWQQEQARLSEALPDWFAAQFYLRRLLLKNPDDAALLARLAEAKKHYESSITPVTAVGPEASR